MKKILAVTASVLVLGGLFLWPYFVKVKVVCLSQYGDCPADMSGKLLALNGKNLASAKRQTNKILKNEFIISEFSTQFKLPSTLRVDILVKKPVFALKEAGSDKFVLVDGDGIVLTDAASTTLPVVEIEGALPKNGDNTSPSNLFALNLMAGVNQMYGVTDSKVSGTTLLVELPGQIRVIFPLDGDSSVLLGSLRLIYSKIQEEGNPNGFREIDLRFKNPVLR